MMNGGNRIVQGLWIGERLSAMERLSIRSFLHHGHAYHLYAYGEVEDVPAGTQVLDAEAILPRASVFQYGAAAKKGKGSYAGFANFFRYKLLMERGGYWADLDVVCLKPFRFAADHVIASERRWRGMPARAVNCVLKAPQGSALAKRCWEACQTKDPARIEWGETGPRLVEQMVAELGMARHVKSKEAFCAIPWFTPRRWILPDGVIKPRWHAAHLSQEIWRRRGWDKEAAYPATSLYEQLKARYL